MELLPCPFCGEKEDISIKKKKYGGKPIITPKGGNVWFVECLPCGSKTDYYYDDDLDSTIYKSAKELAILY